jgi:endonuclease/exonuclease/phosphatase family metal-dependent hydrolase
LTGNFAGWQWQFSPSQKIRLVNWNIDRGLHLPEITDFLASQQADLVTLQEVDLNARRTHRLNVAEELARKLGLNYVFGLTQGSRTSPAYHGPVSVAVRVLVSAMVSAANRALSGADRWAYCLGWARASLYHLWHSRFGFSRHPA